MFQRYFAVIFTIFLIRSLDVQYNIVGTFNREKVSLDFIYKLGLPDVGAQLPPHLGDGPHALRPREVPEEVLVEVLIVRVKNVVATVQPFSFLCYPRMGFLNKWRVFIWCVGDIYFRTSTLETSEVWVCCHDSGPRRIESSLSSLSLLSDTKKLFIIPKLRTIESSLEP